MNPLPPRTLLPHEAQMPHHYDVDALNRYLQHWDQEFRASWFLRVEVPAFLLATLVTWCFYQEGLGTIYLIAIFPASLYGNYLLLRRARAGAITRKSIWFLCPFCQNELIISSEEPNSAWECPACRQFQHFQYWQATGSRTVTLFELASAFVLCLPVTIALYWFAYPWYWLIVITLELFLFLYVCLCTALTILATMRGKGPYDAVER